jgi:hypothetical protein
MWDARHELLSEKFLTNSIDKSKMELFLNTGDFDPTNYSLTLEDFF